MDQESIALTALLLQGAMVLSPFILTWVFCDRPETFIKRCLRATAWSLAIIALSAVVLLLFFPAHFPAGEIAARTRETAVQAVVAAFLAPLFGADFLMRIKMSRRYWKSKGHTDL